MSHRRIALIAGVTAIVVACNDSITGPPLPDFDSSLYPYILSPRGVRIHGTSRVLVIPARFSDGAPEPISSAQIRAQLFGSVNGGPVAESFSLASGGTFTLRGEVTEWVTTAVTIAAINGPTATGMDLYAREAVDLADPDVDFGRFDNDGPDGWANSGDDDGVVDGGLVLLNSDHNRYCDGGTGLGPHPSARSGWNVGGAPVPTQDSSANGGVIGITGYTPMSATACGGTSVGAHVMAHELGHIWFGLPDLYHIMTGATGQAWERRRWVVGCWELMAAGGWGCGSGEPTLDYRFNTFGAWARATIGWVQPLTVDIARDSVYDLFAMGSGGTVLRVPITANEYLLVEYRQQIPGDRRIPASGVLIYHIAEGIPLRPTTLTGSYRISLIEADDDSLLVRMEPEGGNRGVGSDAFGITRLSFRNGEHSRARAVNGSPLPFAISEITLIPAQRRARLRISPP